MGTQTYCYFINLIFRDDADRAQENKMYNDLQKSVKKIESSKPEVKSELDDVKPDVKIEPPATPAPQQMFNDMQRGITPTQQMALQVSIKKKNNLCLFST